MNNAPGKTVKQAPGRKGVYMTKTKLLTRVMAFAFALAAALAIAPATALAAGVEVTVQPEDVEVAFPAAASFHVEVDNPDIVTSYHWVASDEVKPFELDGSTAYTDTLVIPSTGRTWTGLSFICVITDNQGHTVYTQPARIIITNEDENKPVLYVGEYALEPGDTLNLEDTALGEGIVAYDSNGTDITFTDVYANVKYPVFDSTLAPSMGLMFDCPDEYEFEYHFHFNGDCVFVNPYFDASRNAAGVVFNSWFHCGDEANKPTIFLEGDGMLRLIGGGNQYYSDANLEIGLTVKTAPNGAVFCDGIRAADVTIAKDTEVQLGVNGTAIHTEGDLRLEEGSLVNIVSVGPHVSVGPTTKNVLFIRGSIYAKDAEMNIRAIGDAAQYHVYNAYLAVWYGIDLINEGNMNLDNSKVTIVLESLRGTDLFGVNWGGVSGEGMGNSVILTNNSILTVSANIPDVMIVDGIYMPGVVSVDASSMIQVDLVGGGEVMGIVAERALQVENGTVSVNVATASDAKTYGIICGKADVTLDNGGSISILSGSGPALAADTGAVREDESEGGWDPAYEAKYITLGGKTAISRPASSGIALATIPYMGNFKLVETIYDTAGTPAPAREVTISGSGSSSGGNLLGGIAGSGEGSSSWPLILVGALVVLGAAVGLAKLAGGKKEAKDE